jgi:hypothetical protein
MPSITYYPSIPQPADAIAASQPQILANFTGIMTFVDVNHYDFSSDNAGKHMFVSLPVQASAPNTAAGEVALFSQTSALTGVPELAFQRQTAGAIIEFTSATLTSPGWSRDPSGLLKKWGTATITGNTTFTLPTGATIPVFSTVVGVIVVPVYSGGTDANLAVSIVSYTTTTFTAYGSPRTTTGPAVVPCIYWVWGT